MPGLNSNMFSPLGSNTNDATFLPPTTSTPAVPGVDEHQQRALSTPEVKVEVKAVAVEEDEEL